MRSHCVLSGVMRVYQSVMIEFEYVCVCVGKFKNSNFIHLIINNRSIDSLKFLEKKNTKNNHFDEIVLS